MAFETHTDISYHLLQSPFLMFEMERGQVISNYSP